MEPEVLQTVKDDVHRKIGRNMLMLQQIEQILKCLIAYGRFSRTETTLENNIKKQVTSVSKKTMGQLVGDFLENTHTEYDDSAETIDHKEIHMSFNFRIETDEVYFEKRKIKELAAIVNERSELIHHLLPTYNLQDPSGYLELENYLDEQHGKLTKETQHFQAILRSLDNSRKVLSEYLKSDEWWDEFRLSEIRHCRLVIWLGQIAQKAARDDGWTLLNHTG